MGGTLSFLVELGESITQPLASGHATLAFDFL